MAQAVGVERALTPVDKQLRIQIIPIFSIGQVTPEYSANTLSYKNGSNFSIFCADLFAMLDHHLPVFHI